ALELFANPAVWQTITADTHVVLVADGFDDADTQPAVDLLGRLMANYLPAASVTTANRLVWAGAGVLTTAGAGVYHRQDGSYVLGPHQPGAWIVSHRRRPGHLPPMPQYSLGSTLPSGGAAVTSPGTLVNPLPSVYQPNPGPRAERDRPKLGAPLSD